MNTKLFFFLFFLPFIGFSQVELGKMDGLNLGDDFTYFPNHNEPGIIVIDSSRVCCYSHIKHSDAIVTVLDKKLNILKNFKFKLTKDYTSDLFNINYTKLKDSPLFYYNNENNSIIVINRVRHQKNAHAVYADICDLSTGKITNTTILTVQDAAKLVIKSSKNNDFFLVDEELKKNMQTKMYDRVTSVFNKNLKLLYTINSDIAESYIRQSVINNKGELILEYYKESKKERQYIIQKFDSVGKLIGKINFDIPIEGDLKYKFIDIIQSPDMIDYMVLSKEKGTNSGASGNKGIFFDNGTIRSRNLNTSGGN